MSGSLILLPLRLGARAVELGLRGATEVVERVAGLAGVKSSESAPARAPEPDTSPGPAPTSVAPPSRPVQTQRTGDPGDAETLMDRGEPVDYDAPEVVEPAHVDTGEELVEEVAEPGAEDGAGAQVRIAEPWDGYRELRAAEIIDRIRTATPEELAAVELFELSDRRRQTVISAAQDELRRRR
jgi:hypothetical protein